jgi:hypothetical protein
LGLRGACRAFIRAFAARQAHLNRFFRPLIENLFRASPEAGKRSALSSPLPDAENAE